MSAAEIAQAVASGRLSAATVVADTLARIAERNPLLNAFTDVTAERAINRAKAIDQAIASGKSVGPLAGVPVRGEEPVRRQGTADARRLEDQS